jgi:hypothetical protein
MADKTLGIPFYKVYPHGRGKRQRFEVWRCVDFGDGSLSKLSCEGSFDNYMEASTRAKLDNEEEARSRASTPRPT